MKVKHLDDNLAGWMAETMAAAWVDRLVGLWGNSLVDVLVVKTVAV